MLGGITWAGDASHALGDSACAFPVMGGMTWVGVLNVFGWDSLGGGITWAGAYHVLGEPGALTTCWVGSNKNMMSSCRGTET